MNELKSVTYNFTSFDELPREGSKIIWHKHSLFNLEIVRVTYYNDWTREEGIFFNNEKISEYELKNTYWVYLEQVL